MQICGSKVQKNGQMPQVPTNRSLVNVKWASTPSPQTVYHADCNYATHREHSDLPEGECQGSAGTTGVRERVLRPDLRDCLRNIDGNCLCIHATFIILCRDANYRHASRQGADKMPDARSVEGTAAFSPFTITVAPGSVCALISMMCPCWTIESTFSIGARGCTTFDALCFGAGLSRL
jgi:hypothetical protein